MDDYRTMKPKLLLRKNKKEGCVLPDIKIKLAKIVWLSVQEYTNSLMKDKTEPRNTQTYMETGFIAEQMLKIYKEKDGP